MKQINFKQIKMKKFILLAISVFTLQMATAQTVVGEVTLPNTLTFNGESLVLNGAGIRKKAIVLKLYSGGLYLPSKNSDASAIISSDDTQAIRLVITSSFVSSDAMSEAVEEGFEASTDGNTSSISAEIKKFKGFFSEEIVETDTFDITNQKGKGVVCYKNGKELGTISGAAFKKALFGIWLGNDPADSKLKKGMLGK
jgi:hypothetical protein